MRVISDGQINFLIQCNSSTHIVNIYNMSVSGIIIGTVVSIMLVVVIDR